MTRTNLTSIHHSNLYSPTQLHFFLVLLVWSFIVWRVDEWSLLLWAIYEVLGRDSPSSTITVFSTSRVFDWNSASQKVNSRDLTLANLAPGNWKNKKTKRFASRSGWGSEPGSFRAVAKPLHHVTSNWVEENFNFKIFQMTFVSAYSNLETGINLSFSQRDWVLEKHLMHSPKWKGDLNSFD